MPTATVQPEAIATVTPSEAIRRVQLEAILSKVDKGFKREIATRGMKSTFWAFGAYYLDPQYLSIVIGVDSDDQRDQLKADDTLDPALRKILTDFGWPRPDVAYFFIESQETVARESDGNWFEHFR